MTGSESGGSHAGGRIDAVPRRRVLGALGLAAGTATVAGCSERARSLLDRDPPGQVSLTVATLPADEDPRATAIAQHLADHLEAVGIAVDVAPMPREQLLRAVLVNLQFDLYVGLFPGGADPDFLRPLLSSAYVETPGWNNPFGLSDPSVDRLLDRQRRVAGAARRRALYDLQEALVRLQPFAVVAFPDAIRAVREDRFDSGRTVGFETPLGYLSLPVATGADRAPEAAAGPDGTVELRLTRTDERITRNLNPVSAPYRSDDTLTGLLYDPLGRRIDGRVRPWLARDWQWSDPDADDAGPVATVRLRPDRSWHDGAPLTAGDVAFTYRFLEDTSMGRAETAVPAPRFSGRVDMVDSVEATDPRTVRVAFVPCSRGVAARAFTVPILPRHVWRPLTGPASVAGVEPDATVTEALVWPNTDPVGSGPFRVGSRIEGSQLSLERFGGHFVFGGDPPGLDDGVAYDRLVFRIAPDDTTAVSLVAAGEADATSSSVAPSTVPRIGETDALELLVSPTSGFYHVGFNVRRSPLGNYRFRQAVARLLDKGTLAADAFAGYARPAASPLAATEFCPPHLEWRGSDPVLPFPGSGGELDVATARQLFVDAGYQYDGEGRLLAEEL